MNDKEDGMQALQNILHDLENKTSKKAQKQVDNIRKYFKDQDIEIKPKEEIDNTKRLKTKPLYLNENNFKRDKIIHRDIDEDGNITLFKYPLLILVKLNNPFNNEIINELKKIESLHPQCLAYPQMKYNAVNHGLIMCCEICWYAFKDHNKFCEMMINITRYLGYKMIPEIEIK